MAFNNAGWLFTLKEGKVKQRKVYLKYVKKSEKKSKKNLKKLHAEEFSCPCDAQKALKRHFSKSKFYEVVETGIEKLKKFESKGRPKPERALIV